MKIVTLGELGTSRSKKTESIDDPSNLKAKKYNVMDTIDEINVDLNTIVDLHAVHKHVMSLFDAKSEEVDMHRNVLNKARTAIPVTVQEKIIHKNYVVTLCRDLERLEDELAEYKAYRAVAPQFLQMYEEFLPKNMQRAVGENEIVIEYSKADQFESLVMQFLTLAMKFSSHIKILNRSSSSKHCKCGGSTVVSDGEAYCTSCNSKVKTSKSGNGSGSSGSEYIRSETFEEALDHVQGRGKKTIPPQVYEVIQNHCDELGIPELRLKKQEFMAILKRNKMSEFYKSINLIRHTMQDRELPCYEHIRSLLLERHRLIEIEYMMIRDKYGRSNFLNVNFVLRACIQMEGQPLNPEDFSTLATSDALKEHNKIMHIICDRIRENQKNDRTIKGDWNFVSISN